MKKILVNGAQGRMGSEVVKLVARSRDFRLVAAVDVDNIGEEIHQLLGITASQVEIEADLEAAIEAHNPEVIVDFTTPQVVMENIEVGLASGTDMVVGTTGITESDLSKIEEWAEAGSANIIIAPNFAIGAILMMEFAQMAAKYFEGVEIIELHHNQKIDAPSGTAIKTAELINQASEMNLEGVEEIEKLSGARGGSEGEINIHSVRLPGLVAHQEVIFGGAGQTFKLRHDSIDRSSFMPGVKMAIQCVAEAEGVVYGLDNLIDL